MNGADLLCDTLLAHDVDVCFANPGTSEMHFVAALDAKPRMRCVLGLFEGVVTAAADGYARMADKPAATLLHTGPGLANSLANMHNARRAKTPMINVVGDHASYHLQHDAPLTRDIESLAKPMSNWVRRIIDAETIDEDAAAAWRAAVALPGVSTLILPGDMAWGEVTPRTIRRVERPKLPAIDARAVQAAAAALRSGKRVALLLGDRALRAEPLSVADAIAQTTNARVMSPTSNARAERGRGRASFGRVPYAVDVAVEALKDVDVMIMVGATVPVAFFAYPGKPGRVVRNDCELITLAAAGQDLTAALEWLADEVGAPRKVQLRPAPDAEALTAAVPSGPLTADAIARVVMQRVPENAILCDEAVTSGTFHNYAHLAAPHDMLALTGGAIGVGLPLATGAAVACPDRKVIGLQADGSGMYTVQALWTQARERLDVISIIFSNRAYAILQGEMRNVGVKEFGRNAERMLAFDDPALDWVSLAKGMGVEGARVTTTDELAKVFEAALKRSGPFLIEAVMP